MASFRHSVAFRMALGYGLLLLISVALISTVFYVGTAGLIARNIDAQLGAMSRRLVQIHDEAGQPALEHEIHELLTDDRDADTEVYLLVDPAGRKLIGNLTAWPTLSERGNGLLKEQVKRLGRDSVSRLLVYRFADGSQLVVGRDMQDQHDLQRMILSALALGGLMALVLAVVGARVFRAQLKRQLNAIHRTTSEISAGELQKRIDVGNSQDEFAIVARDINAMLDEIQRLMDTTRNVSNAIAHDLRTPLGRIRGALEHALQEQAPQEQTPQPQQPSERLTSSAHYAIDEIDALTAVLDRLLQIAEAESGVRRQHFERLRLSDLAGDLVELYQPAAESEGIQLDFAAEGEPYVEVDRDLLASTLANLLDNALKYAGRGAQVQVRVGGGASQAYLVVQDDGPGIPSALMSRVTERFFRIDASRHQRGNGLGLSIVEAVVTLHRGTLSLSDAAPGLRVQIALPANLSKS